MMGETGPCGPCSEIHMDLRTDDERERIPGRDRVNKDDPCVIELWNLVFIQFNAASGGVLEPLAARHVDTGMGLERLSAILQGVTSTYDTDLFAPLMDCIAALSPLEAVQGYDNITDEENRAQIRVAMRVVADHIRAIAFAIADGVVPGNVGRAYVIRRILRRAARYGYTTLEFREPFLYKLVSPLTGLMRTQFKELEVHQERIERNIRGEEAAFLRTLGNGIALFECIAPFAESFRSGDPKVRQMARKRLEGDARAADLLQKAYPDTAGQIPRIDRFSTVASKGMMPGEVVFLLHDTYGFPLDLTRLMAREKGLDIDTAGYNASMAKQMQRARKDLRARNIAVSSTASQEDWQVISSGHDSAFLGYETLKESGLAVRALHAGRPYMVVLDATPFYAERGGQIGDTGILRIGGEEIRVLDTQAVNGQVRHVVDRLPDHAPGPVFAAVDSARRKRICKHHTATHLLHAALRKVLGPGVTQKGSLVAPGHLRFDFSHFEKVSAGELGHIQEIVNSVIQRNVPAQIESDVPIEQALARGATALFGEKYGSRVRVVVFDKDFSVELCGGTHVGATGEVGLMLLRSEGSIAAGVRRVEAISGLDALSVAQAEMSELGRARDQLKDRQGGLDVSVASLQKKNRALQKEVERLRSERLAAGLDSIVQSAEHTGPWRLAVGRVDNAGMNTLRTLGEKLRIRLGKGSVGVLGAADPGGEKAYLVATVSDDLVRHGVEAGKIVGQIARHIGGGGGGRPQLATAGGRSPQMLDDALSVAARIVADAVPATFRQATR